MAMKFTIREGACLHGRLTYSDSEYGFSFHALSGEELMERRGSKGITSALIDTLQLEVDIESRELLFVWGYLPNVRGCVAKLAVPASREGRVAISTDAVFHQGVSFDVPGSGWQTYFDPASGWINIQLRDAEGMECIQIADGVLLGIKRGDLVSVWLRPAFEV